MPVIAARRPHQAPVQHPPEAEAAEDRSRARLRFRRASRRHRVGEGLLRGARHHPPDVVAGPGPDQGLHRDAAAERLSVAAHLRRQRARISVRGPDQDRGDAPARRGGDRRALEVQGRPRRRQSRRAVFPLDAAAARGPAGRCGIRRSSCRTSKIDLYPEEVYIFTPKGEVKSLPRGATAVDFAYTIHTDVGTSVRRRPHQRQDGSAAHASAERRHRRDHHAVRPQAEPRLADVRRDVARAQQDPARAAGARSASAASTSVAACSTRKCGASV